MPLYLSEQDFNSFLFEEVAQSLRTIALQTEHVAVTPSIALTAIKRYLEPLVSEECRYIFDRRAPATWNGIHAIYGSLGGWSGINGDPLLSDVVKAVLVIYSHTTQPPREFAFPAAIEATYFLSLCNLSRIPMQDHLLLVNRVGLFSFCNFCWRHPLPGRKLCAYHAPNSPLESDEGGYQSAAARYKSGARQKEEFDHAVNRILTQEVIEFHDSRFTATVLWPEQDIKPWLRERRPLLWQMLGKHQQEINDNNAIDLLLNLLHNPDGLTSRANRKNALVNLHLRQHPLLVWPMLLRAEGWFQSWKERRENWGGGAFWIWSPERESQKLLKPRRYVFANL